MIECARVYKLFYFYFLFVICSAAEFQFSCSACRDFAKSHMLRQPAERWIHLPSVPTAPFLRVQHVLGVKERKSCALSHNWVIREDLY